LKTVFIWPGVLVVDDRPYLLPQWFQLFRFADGEYDVFKMGIPASVSDKELQYFLGLLNQLVDDKQPESVTIITWDTKVQTVTQYGKGQNIPNVALSGRGGTAIRPVFKHVDHEQIDCDQMIVLSDLQIFDYPEVAPRYPVLWVSSWQAAKEAPFGETTYMNAA